MRTDKQAIKLRNSQWDKNPLIPGWVDIETVGLDQFFTRPEIAALCHKSLKDLMGEDGAKEQDYKFVEPSAGAGAFYDLLPDHRRVGIDIVPMNSEYISQDFLSWSPKKNGYRYTAIGNPPFGYRAWLALAFMNHAATFCDYVGFILPMAFQSEGKGSPKHRVDGLRLVHSEILPRDSFTDKNGEPVKINALWQVWHRGVNNMRYPSFNGKWIDIFSIDNNPQRLCGHHRMSEADCFLTRSFFSNTPSIVHDFRDVSYGGGHGIVIKKGKKKILDALFQADWIRFSNLAAHGCRHISKHHIYAALTHAGYSDS